MLLEGLFHIRDGDGVTAGIPVHQAVAAHRNVRKHERTYRNVRLYRSGSAYPEYVQGLPVLLYLPCPEIYVGKGIQLVHDYVNIVRAYACGKHGESFAAVFSGHGNELPRLAAEFLVIQIPGNHVHASGVADEDYVVCKFLRSDVKMEYGPVIVDYQF